MESMMRHTNDGWTDWEAVSRDMRDRSPVQCRGHCRVLASHGFLPEGTPEGEGPQNGESVPVFDEDEECGEIWEDLYGFSLGEIPEEWGEPRNSKTDVVEVDLDTPAVLNAGYAIKWTLKEDNAIREFVDNCLLNRRLKMRGAAHGRTAEACRKRWIMIWEKIFRNFVSLIVQGDTVGQKMKTLGSWSR
jgi:hypothetical protein